MGPGSLYTSLIPNLLVPEITEAIAESKALRLYVCNIMTQPGETDGYTVSDHIRAIDRITGHKLFDSVLVQKTSPSAQSLIRYAQEMSHPVFFDREQVMLLGRRALVANVMDEDEDTGYVRHNSDKLARVLLRWYGKIRG